MMGGRIEGMLVYGRILTSEEHDLVWGHMQRKWYQRLLWSIWHPVRARRLRLLLKEGDPRGGRRV